MSLPAAAMGPDSGERKPILIEPCAATSAVKVTESRTASNANRVAMCMASDPSSNAPGGLPRRGLLQQGTRGVTDVGRGVSRGKGFEGLPGARITGDIGAQMGERLQPYLRRRVGARQLHERFDRDSVVGLHE